MPAHRPSNEAILWLIILDAPINVYYPFGLVEDVPNLMGDFYLAVIVRVIELGNKRLQCRGGREALQLPSREHQI